MVRPLTQRFRARHRRPHGCRLIHGMADTAECAADCGDAEAPDSLLAEREEAGVATGVKHGATAAAGTGGSGSGSPRGGTGTGSGTSGIPDDTRTRVAFIAWLLGVDPLAQAPGDARIRG